MDIEQMTKQELKSLIKELQASLTGVSEQKQHIEPMQVTGLELADPCAHFQVFCEQASSSVLSLGACSKIQSCHVANLNHQLEQRILARTQDLVDSQQQLSAILNAIPDAVITFNRAGYISHANRAAERILVYDKDEILGLNVRQLISDAHQHAFDDIVIKKNCHST